MSMVSFLSCECSDQAEGSEGMGVPGASIVVDGFGPKAPERDTARSLIPRCHHPRKRMIQYSAAGPYIADAGVYWIPRFRGV
jgi:hypothetical protein